MRMLDNHLKTHSFVAGDILTIADLNMTSYLFVLFRFVWDEKFRKQIPNLTRWFDQIQNMDCWKQEYGRPMLCAKALEFPTVSPPEKKEEKKEEKKKEEKKPEEKPAATKKAAKKEKEEEEEDDEGKEEKKEKNPLDSLPPSSFNFFDFKTLFVNAPNKQEALDFFWKNYDPAGFSIWFIEYEKAEGEGKVLYLTNNLAFGLFQRLDHFRKYAFAVHGVYGEEPTLEIRGVWLWRGTEIPKEVKELDTYEYHKFTKLDHTNEKDKKKVNEFWNGLTEDVDLVDGLKARTVKYFK